VNLTSDRPFWTVRDGLIHAYPPLQRNLRCDAVIVGGGISGALLSRQLIKNGVDCVLIDRRDIGHGSTSASTALLQYEIDVPLYKLRSSVGESKANRAYLLGVETIRQLQKLSGSDCGFATRPSLHLALKQSDKPGLEKELAARREIGIAVEILLQSDLRRSGMRGVAALRSSIAAEVDPYRLTHRLLNESAKAGLRIYDRTTATHYTHSRSGVSVHTDRGARIQCRDIFFASGYETRDFLPKNIVTLKSTYALVSEPINDLGWWTDRALIWGTGNPYIYMRTTADGRVLVGGKDDSVLNPDQRDRQLEKKTGQLVRAFHSVFPAIGIEPAFSWAGIFGSTKDGLAYIGKHPAFPRAYFALGFGGNGITFSQIAARLLSDAFLGRKNPDQNIFRFDR
jgi:glycine/D-amino acid oxidase-like deaminating enzyme